MVAEPLAGEHCCTANPILSLLRRPGPEPRRLADPLAEPEQHAVAAVQPGEDLAGLGADRPEPGPGEAACRALAAYDAHYELRGQLAEPGRAAGPGGNARDRKSVV